jgi:acetyl esterase/lipase
MLRIMLIFIAFIACAPRVWSVTYDGCATQGFYNVVSPYQHFQPKFDGTHHIDLYLPNTSTPKGLIIYLHGGGWKGTNVDFTCHWMNWFGNVVATGNAVWALNRLPEKFAIASIEYSEATEVPPTIGGRSDNIVRQVKEIKYAIRWLKSQKSTYNLNTSKIILAGASAGGHLAALTALTEGEPLYDPVVPKELRDFTARVNLVFAQSGIYNIGTYDSPEQFWRDQLIPNAFGCYQIPANSWRPCSTQTIRDSSPVFHITPDDPKVYLVHGAQDTIVMPQQADDFARALCAAGKLAYNYRIEGFAHNLDPPLTDHPFIGEILRVLLESPNQIPPNC